MARRTRLALWLVIALAALAAVGAPQARKPRVDPRMVSAHPFVGQRGTTFVATVRGTGLRGATAVFAPGAPLRASVAGTETEPAPTTGRNRTATDLVRLQVELPADARPGRYPFRLVTAQGLTNALSLWVTEHPVLPEPEGPHESAETAIPVTAAPAVYTGRLARRGETDYYALEGKAGETVTFEAISGLPSIGAAGGNANGFDPSLQVFEPSGSWFDAKRLNRIAANDEPLWVIGRGTDALLVHRFARAGRYLVRIEAFSGQGGPDYSYQLRIVPGPPPSAAAQPAEGWEERGYSRALAADRIELLAARGGRTGKGTAVGAVQGGAFALPAIVEGTLQNPRETGRARFRIDGPTDIAIEVETPTAAPPLFNPVVRLVDGAGTEVASNLFAGRGACTGALTKSLQAKTLVPLRDAGEYTLEIRDLTSDLAGPTFCYRVLVRAQIPHVGNVRVEEDRINLAPGEAKTVRVSFDREEDFRGVVAVSAEALPPGVEALAGADYDAEPDRPPSAGKRERYAPHTERAVVVFRATERAVPADVPCIIRLTVRTVVDGRVGAVLATRELPLMVIGEP
jgi:hypothetical protein